jgi:Protein of unknown function (DUF3592)
MVVSGNSRGKMVGPVMALVGLGFVYSGYEKGNTAALLKKEGAVVTGIVIGHETVSGRRGSKKYKLAMEYAPKDSGRRVTQKFEVPKTVFEGAPDGSEVDVRYLPSDPSVAEIEGAGNDGVVEMGIGGVIGVIGALIAAVTLRKEAEPAPASGSP